VYNRTAQEFETFKVLAVGDYWGHNSHSGAREKTPIVLGVAFDLVKSRTPADRVPPQGMRDQSEYLPARK